VKCNQNWKESLRVTRADSRQSDLACAVSLIREERKVGASKRSSFWNERVGVSYFGNFRGRGVHQEGTKDWI